MKKTLFYGLIFSLLLSCKTHQKADLIVINATIYTVNKNFDKAQSFAVKDGKFIGIGSNNDIQKKYSAPQIIDAKNKPIYPGFIDGHCHFYGLGLQQQKVNLVGTKSYDQVLEKLVAFQKEKRHC
ncbi:amidohydrolase family protein [Tenacibaculum finnmarkense]|uniref:amidohydrolase family protein n=1 Tax=Tenacibaculum finnmarkense TaxID=2781243 RepID=UPI001E589309|nr:amidohydrolase family protein [Tenacibaculum finnmarkense]MCD8413179.1 amidohydrolase family protein [Tenacibaculum finnmarkense genomovar ulcerans]